jgi:hypothetical protein
MEIGVEKEQQHEEEEQGWEGVSEPDKGRTSERGKRLAGPHAAPAALRGATPHVAHLPAGPGLGSTFVRGVSAAEFEGRWQARRQELAAALRSSTAKGRKRGATASAHDASDRLAGSRAKRRRELT